MLLTLSTPVADMEHTLLESTLRFLELLRNKYQYEPMHFCIFFFNFCQLFNLAVSTELLKHAKTVIQVSCDIIIWGYQKILTFLYIIHRPFYFEIILKLFPIISFNDFHRAPLAAIAEIQVFYEIQICVFIRKLTFYTY